MSERQRSALTDSQPQKGFRQPAMQVLAELQVDRVTGRVGQGQNRQFEAPRRDWHMLDRLRPQSSCGTAWISLVLAMRRALI